MWGKLLGPFYSWRYLKNVVIWDSTLKSITSIKYPLEEIFSKMKVSAGVIFVVAVLRNQPIKLLEEAKMLPITVLTTAAKTELANLLQNEAKEGFGK